MARPMNPKYQEKQDCKTRETKKQEETQLQDPWNQKTKNARPMKPAILEP